MIDPLPPHSPTPCSLAAGGWMNEEHGCHPEGVAVKGGRALPGDAWPGTPAGCPHQPHRWSR